MTAPDPGPPVPPGWQAEMARLREQVRAQQEVIDALVETAEGSAASVVRLGTQQAVEDRTAHLQHAERVLRSVVEALDGGLCIVGADGTVLDANRRWLDRLRPDGSVPGPPGSVPGPPGTVPGDIGTDVFAWCRTAEGLGELGGEVAEAIADVIRTPAGGPTAPAEPRAVKGRLVPPAGGEERWIVVRVHPIRDHDRARAVVSLIDITDGMNTQEQLRRATEEAQRLALVARATDKGVVITLPDGTVEWVNEPFARRTGYPLAEAVGRSRAELMGPEGRARPDVVDFLRRLRRQGVADGEFPMTSRFGDRYWASIEVRPVIEDGAVAHLVWVESDVTAQRDTQQRLREAMTRAESLAAALTREKSLLAGVISAVPQMVYWKDGRGRYVGCNAAYLAVRGFDHETRLLGRTEDELGLDDAVGAGLGALEAEVVATGAAIVDRRADLADRDGDRRALLLSVLPLDRGGAGDRAVIGVGADITHANELERQLAQANRLESMGQLAAGIAHEINTPIQYVTDNTRFVAQGALGLLEVAERFAARAADGAGTVTAREVADALGPLDLEFLSTEMPGALAESLEGLARVAEIVRAMKDYAHPGTGRTDLDVNRAISSTVHVCRNEWKYVADVDLDLDPAAGLVPCYEGELKQVVLNMVVNAAQALGERPGTDLPRGTIRIRTRRTGDEMLITIADDGPGMDERVRHRAFDPFFTTKPVGRGTGQGLTLAHAVVVTKHHGRIDLETAPGRGATFTIHLPLTVPEAAGGDPRTESRPGGGT